MCGRFNITDKPTIHALLDELGINIGPLPTRYNIAPTEPVATIFHDVEAGYTIGDMRWWLTPSWSDGPSQKYAMFNARAETLDTSRAYKGPFRHHRAIIPATSFIEWQTVDGKKQPYEIKPVEGCLFFAAVWDHWTNGDAELYSCSIVTTAAVKSFREIHHRQPVMLNIDEAKSWVLPGQDMSTLKKLMKPKLPGALEVTPINSAIGDTRNTRTVQSAGEAIVINHL